MPREMHGCDAGRKSNHGVPRCPKSKLQRSFQPQDTEQVAESRGDSKRHVVLGLGPGPRVERLRKV